MPARLAVAAAAVLFPASKTKGIMINRYAPSLLPWLQEWLMLMAAAAYECAFCSMYFVHMQSRKAHPCSSSSFLLCLQLWDTALGHSSMLLGQASLMSQGGPPGARIPGCHTGCIHLMNQVLHSQGKS